MSLNPSVLLACDTDETANALQPSLHRLQCFLPKTDIALMLPGFNQSELLPDSGVQIRWISSWLDVSTLQRLSQATFKLAILFTAPGRSPYTMAYICYLAGIPIRLGQSVEFGGGVLTSCVHPIQDYVSVENYHLHLSHSIDSFLDLTKD